MIRCKYLYYIVKFEDTKQYMYLLIKGLISGKTQNITGVQLSLKQLEYNLVTNEFFVHINEIFCPD